MLVAGLEGPGRNHHRAQGVGLTLEHERERQRLAGQLHGPLSSNKPQQTGLQGIVSRRLRNKPEPAHRIGTGPVESGFEEHVHARQRLARRVAHGAAQGGGGGLGLHREAGQQEKKQVEEAFHSSSSEVMPESGPLPPPLKLAVTEASDNRDEVLER